MATFLSTRHDNQDGQQNLDGSRRSESAKSHFCEITKAFYRAEKSLLDDCLLFDQGRSAPPFVARDSPQLPLLNRQEDVFAFG